MRVAIDALTLSAEDTGVGIWTRGLIESLARWGGGHEFVVYHGLSATGLAGLAGSAVRLAGVPVLNRVRPLRILWEHGRLPRRLRRDGVDVLHCPSYVQPLRAGVPTVLTLHDLFARTHPELCKWLNLRHFRLMLGPSIRRAAVIHCTSEWTREMLRREFGNAADKAHVVHPCADDIFRPGSASGGVGDTLARHGLDGPPFLFVGNPEPKKGLTVLLKALALLRERTGCRRKLLLVGPEGRQGRPVRDCVRELDLGTQVVRAGYLPRADMPDVYRCALALVFPSLGEGFGLPPLEAMACGTPVVATHAGGLRESVGEAGLVVPPNDVEALADAMDRVERSSELRERLRTAGLERARRFRWRDAIPRVLRLYEAAATGGGAV